MGELLSIGSRRLPTSLASNRLETGRLCWQAGTATDSAHLDAGHGTGDPKIALIGLFHQSDAVGALNVLRRVLAGGEEYSSYDVGSVGIEPTDAASHGRADEILLYVDVNDGLDVGFERRLDDGLGYGGLYHDGLASSLNPIHGGI